ncbi:MAG: hypothetical protein FJ098_12645, partial [Deltaproteobacteria bacterium]|nr:hypothetical protein [Deltaproteobacteria bacterium]
HVEETPRFRFETPAAHARALAPLVAAAEDVRRHHCRLIKPCFEGRITVKVLPEEEGFRRAQPGGHIDWAAGIAYADRSLILLRLDEGMILDLLETFEHEVSHILLLNAMPRRPPRWFIEGLAILQARQDLIQRFEAAAGAALRGRLISLDDLEETFPPSAAERRLAYAQSGLFLHFLQSALGGPGGLRELLGRMAGGEDLPDAVQAISGRTLSALEDEWRDTFGTGMRPWIVALRDAWWLWTLMVLLFLVAVAAKLRRVRRRRRVLAAEDAEWEYRH